MKAQLAPVMRAEADRSDDPRERVRLYGEAMALAAEQSRLSFLPDLAQAEFEAGDDDAARRR